jgi:twitching motility protein PilT
MVPNSAIRNLIRDDKVHQIYGTMQTGQLKYGMQTFNQSLSDLVQRGDITMDVGLSYSSNPDELREMINRGSGTLNAQPGAANQGKAPAGVPQGGRNPNIKYT